MISRRTTSENIEAFLICVVKTGSYKIALERNLLTIQPCTTISHHLNYKSTTIVFFKIDYQQPEYVRSYRASDDTV